MTGDPGLEFLAEERVPVGPGDLVAREAWAGRLVVALVLLAFGFAVPIAAYLGAFEAAAPRFEASFESLIGLAAYAIGGLMVLVMTLAGLLGGWAFLTTAMAAWRPANWVLRASPDGLYLKLRDYTDHRLGAGDAVVAFIPRRQVRWLRTHDERVRVVGTRDVARARDDRLARQEYLEIRLQSDDLSGLEARLDEERRRWVRTFLPGVTMQAKGTAVAVRGDGLVRLDWRTKGTRLRPALSAARDHLARHYRFAEGVEAEQAPLRDLDRTAQESRLLDMVRQGNSIDAVRLAQNLYGFTTTEAKQFLDELQEG